MPPRIAAVSEIPVIADADNGYGGPLNVRRTVQLYERAGVAAIHLEDQVLPKRCGHLAGKQLISARDMVAKIKAATDARDRCRISCSLLAPMHWRSTGWKRRSNGPRLYREAGADILFIESTRDGASEGNTRAPAIPDALQHGDAAAKRRSSRNQRSRRLASSSSSIPIG